MLASLARARAGCEEPICHLSSSGRLFSRLHKRRAAAHEILALLCMHGKDYVWIERRLAVIRFGQWFFSFWLSSHGGNVEVELEQSLVYFEVEGPNSGRGVNLDCSYFSEVWPCNCCPAVFCFNKAKEKFFFKGKFDDFRKLKRLESLSIL